jgi:hypothetical protein
MMLKDILSTVNTINGAYVDLGYGKGTQTKEIYSLMLNESITKRDFILIDLFEGRDKGIWQKAYDQCNEVINRVGTKAKYIKEDITSPSFKLDLPLAIVNIDLGEATIQGLNKIFYNTATGGILLIREYLNPSIKEQIDKFIKLPDNNCALISKGDYHYIVKGVQKLKKLDIKRTRSILT